MHGFPMCENGHVDWRTFIGRECRDRIEPALAAWPLRLGGAAVVRPCRAGAVMRRTAISNEKRSMP